MVVGGQAPAAVRMSWLVDAYLDPSVLTTGEISAMYDVPADWADWTPEREIDFLANGPHAASRPFTIERTEVGDEHDATSILVGADGKRWSVTCWVDPGPPHRITRVRTIPAPPDGLTIRLAEPADSAALAELERRAPIRLGADRITYMSFDHGEDYFGPARLMEEVTIYVAESEGNMHGVYCGAVQPVQIGGEPKRLFLEHHVRIDPGAPRGGVFWALCNFGRDRYSRSADSIAFYVAEENFGVRKFVHGTPSWPEPVYRALLPCRPGAGRAGRGRRASASDAAEVAEILNACHSPSVLYVPYTSRSLAERLGRDPSQYGWEDALISDGAAIGVGRGMVGVTKRREDVVEHTVRATALDHGFRPGHEDEYRDLLRQCCSELAARGATHLAVYTSEHAPTRQLLQDLAVEVERFDFWAFALPAPGTLEEHGMYVDPVYF